MSPALANKIAAILPRLASSHDGEVIATARAIARTLKSAGHDWHDLAASIRSKPSPAAMTWAVLDEIDKAPLLRALLDEACLSPWERQFVSSVLPYWRRLTPKQIAIIDNILAREAPLDRAA